MSTTRPDPSTSVTSLVERLACECTPNKVYANRASLRRHQQTQRHVEFVKRHEERDLRVRLAEAESENARLRRDVERLSEYLRHPSKRQVSGRTKKDVAAKAGWKCETCARTVNANFEIDHKVPLFLGGTNEVDNLQLLCPDCHRTKTAADLRRSATTRP